MKLYYKKRKRVLKRLLVGLSLFGIGILASAILSWLPDRFFPSVWLSRPFFLIFLMALVAVLAYKNLDHLYTEILKRYLWRKRNYAHITLMNLAEELDLILDPHELANLVVNTFGEVLHLKTVAVIVPNKKQANYEIVSGYGWNISDYRRINLPQDSALINLIKASGSHVLVRNRVIRTLAWQEANNVAHDFDLLHAHWIIPLFAKQELIGLLAFSAVQSNRVFDEADFQFFREFGKSLAKNIHNALLFGEIHQANMELQDAQSKLIQATKQTAIEQLATGIAHEIHNPLTIISGKAQILLLQKDRSNLDSKVEDVLKTIVEQTKRASDITRKLLMFSQGSGIAKEPLRLEQILNDTLALVSYQTTLEGIRVNKQIDSNLPSFHGNIHEIREVFFNLILNAVQSLKVRGGISVEMKYYPEDEVIQVQVADTGQGIAEENIDKLFNPFFTTRHNALGLGLFVTKQIIHRYGGSIRVESRLGEGSLFIIRLPGSDTAKLNPLENEQKATLSAYPAVDSVAKS